MTGKLSEVRKLSVKYTYRNYESKTGGFQPLGIHVSTISSGKNARGHKTMHSIELHV